MSNGNGCAARTSSDILRLGQPVDRQPDGSFSLSYEDSEFRIRNDQEKRPDILLLVFAPEAPGKTISDLVVFASPEIRQDAGRLESYLVQLSAEDLKKAG